MKPIGNRSNAADLFAKASIIPRGKVNYEQLADEAHKRLVAKEYQIYAIDFDGTIVESHWPAIGLPNWRMIYAIRRMQAQGHKFILWTNRQDDCLQCPNGLLQAVEFCEYYEIPPDAVNDNLPEILDIFGGFNPRKITADYYIDDKSPGSIDWFCARFDTQQEVTQ